MYYVITKRVVKSNTGNTAKFSPKTANNLSYTISGPFSGQETAETAALSALRTHTCLSAQILTSDQAENFARQTDTDYLLSKAIRSALQFA